MKNFLNTENIVELTDMSDSKIRVNCEATKCFVKKEIKDKLKHLGVIVEEDEDGNLYFVRNNQEYPILNAEPFDVYGMR